MKEDDSMGHWAMASDPVGVPIFAMTMVHGV
jgi:hypothetical protein